MAILRGNLPFFRPKFGDCTHHLNCHLRRFKPSFDPFRKASIPGQFFVGDIDGVLVLENGNVLFLEFKTMGVEVSERQMRAYNVLSAKEGQDAVVVWHKAGSIDSPVGYQFITEGKAKERNELTNGQQGLIDVLRAWAYLQDPPKDMRAMTAKLDRIRLERDNLIRHVVFCVDEIAARQEGRSLDSQWLDSASCELRNIDWRVFELSRISDFRKAQDSLREAQDSLRKAQSRIVAYQWVTCGLIVIVIIVLLQFFN